MKPLGRKKKNQLVPEPALRRMPCYLSYLKLAQKDGQRYISSTLIARDMGVDPTQVTKDLSYTSIVGKTRVGYEVEPLIEVLESFLGFTVVDEAYLFGVGSLGKALLHDHGLKQFGLKVVAAFDVNSEIVGKTVQGVPIYHFDDFKQMSEKGVRIGILTVPVENKEQVANEMVKGGIEAIWNFTKYKSQRRCGCAKHLFVCASSCDVQSLKGKNGFFKIVYLVFQYLDL